MGTIAELKHRAVDLLLQQEDYVLLVINPMVKGVKLPEPLLEARQPVPINLGHNMAIPVPDLQLDQHGISATLSFDRTPFGCFFPWPSVMQVSVGDEHLVWVVPLDEAEALAEPEASDSKGKPHLRLV